MIDITELTDRIYDTVMKHKTDKDGEFARWLWQNKNGDRELGANAYGCADAVNILYTLGRLDTENGMRQKLIDGINAFQNPDSGLFLEKTHHPIHTTAHCTAALELLDAKPAYELTQLKQYKDKDALYSFLDNLEWEKDPWNSSHKGAGIYSALVLAGEADVEWEDWYFDWFYDNTDPETGLWKKNGIKIHQWGKYFSHMPNIAAAFHYMFNHEYAKRPLRYPEKIIDTALDIYYNYSEGGLKCHIDFANVDWIYCVNRATRQTAHRFDECKKALREYAKEYVEYLYSIDSKTDDAFNDLHMLFGSLCAVAELAQAVPGEIKSRKPLRLVLDRRPFI